MPSPPSGVTGQITPHRTVSPKPAPPTKFRHAESSVKSPTLCRAPAWKGPRLERNWAGNHEYAGARLERPASLDELAEVVGVAPRVRAIGSRHSFTDIVDSDVLVSLEALPPVFELDAETRTVTIGGGARYGEVSQALHDQGWALANLASLPHISVAGAVATGDARLGRHQCVPGHRRGWARAGGRVRSGAKRPPRRPRPRRDRRRPRGAGDRHHAHPRRRAGVRRAPGRLDRPALRGGGGPLRRDHVERVLGQPVHRLLRRRVRAGVGEEPRGGGAGGVLRGTGRRPSSCTPTSGWWPRA